jgi:hypothetical protein
MEGTQYKTKEYCFNRNYFFWYFLMKAKKFRPDYDYYKSIKRDIEHITNLL